MCATKQDEGTRLICLNVDSIYNNKSIENVNNSLLNYEDLSLYKYRFVFPPLNLNVSQHTGCCITRFLGLCCECMRQSNKIKLCIRT